MNSLVLLALIFGSLGASRSASPASRSGIRQSVSPLHRLPRSEVFRECRFFSSNTRAISPSHRRKEGPKVNMLLCHLKALLDKTDYFWLVYHNIEPIPEQMSSDSSCQKKRAIEIEKQDENICIALCVVAMCRSYKDEWIPHTMGTLRLIWPERDDIIELFEVDERLIREKSPYRRGEER